MEARLNTRLDICPLKKHSRFMCNHHTISLPNNALNCLNRTGYQYLTSILQNSRFTKLKQVFKISTIIWTGMLTIGLVLNKLSVTCGKPSEHFLICYRSSHNLKATKSTYINARLMASAVNRALTLSCKSLTSRMTPRSNNEICYNIQ